MNARDHFREAERALAHDPLTSIAHGVLAVAAAMGADFDPADPAFGPGLDALLADAKKPPVAPTTEGQ